MMVELIITNDREWIVVASEQIITSPASRSLASSKTNRSHSLTVFCCELRMACCDDGQVLFFDGGACESSCDGEGEWGLTGVLIPEN